MPKVFPVTKTVKTPLNIGQRRLNIRINKYSFLRMKSPQPQVLIIRITKSVK